ncbi:Ig domain-containing protein [Streptomyces endophyticus]|uniref:Ig domain-containing protein n=1 Tax=Streptomyces endophyticus TaxID=714166 RepID=A0ABU6F7R1_9ACTN|nr:Ig domain-containing protein [Streptomyces endophyticus]MEB8339508.1 Ig domain-containing protein [Streptomyces endophyticus]
MRLDRLARHDRRDHTRLTVLGAGALALGLAVTAAGPVQATGAAAGRATVPSGRTAVHPAHGTADAAYVLNAGYLVIGLDRAGTVVSLTDARTGRDHTADGKTASLVSLVVDGKQIRPTRVTVADGAKPVLRFTNAEAGTAIDVKAVAKGGYTTLEAVRVKGPDRGDVQTLLWGPLATDVTQTVGEAAGVVHDDDFAIGLRPLTDRTEGAWPQEYQDFGWESEVADNPSRLQVAPHEEWSAAGRTPWGSVLRAFTYDYTKERTRQNVGGHRIPVGPLPGSRGKIAGSAIALFGAAPALTPTVLSDIASGEGLPYPTQNGQWQKTAQASSQSFLVLSDLNTGNIPQSARLAKAAGINYLYSLPNAVGPWRATGHYEFNASLGGSDAGAAAAVKLAEDNGVHLGVHTISDFVSTDDAYVTAPADPRLALGGRARLTRPLGAGDTTLHLDDDTLLAAGLHNKLLRIGDEFIGYTDAVKAGDEWQLTGLHRAQWGSTAAAHATADTASRVIVNSYNGAIGGLGVIDEIAGRLGTAWNATGIRANSYDGVESASESGWGSYGQARLINGAFAQNHRKDGFVTETSRMTSNTWDALTRASWGEVGVTSMDQVFINNEFYKDNFLPGMLGWVSLKSSEGLTSIESKLARGAGLNAGVGFQASYADLNRGGDASLKILDAIKQWESARNLGAFTEAQKALLRDRTTNWHLRTVADGKEWSLQQLDASGAPVGEPQRVAVPTPALSGTALPAAHVRELYEARLTTNTPATVRYEVTTGALPQGLRLNRDTGGITGTPKRPGTSAFTVTAHSAEGQPDAEHAYRLTVG